VNGCIGERWRQLADELDAEAALERRREALRRIDSPSALIQRMREDWPDQDAAVHRLAKRKGIPLGEAWARTIAAGVNSITKGRR